MGLGLVAAGVWLFFHWNWQNGSGSAITAPGVHRYADSDHRAGAAYPVMDEKGLLVTMVSRKVLAGDEVITAAGKRFRVEKVDGCAATARLMGMDRDILAYDSYFSKLTLPAATAEWGRRPVAIYHTHTDESYLPSDGKSSIPFRGGIIQVGSSYKNELLQEGAKVLHNKTPHDPHDNNAYYRSRRTAFKLMRQKPLALFDVHRDGIDNPDFYREYIDNKNVAQIRIVIGRQNPKMKANLDFAKRMMTYANKINPKIVKEIFITQGNYNQDLMPTALLLEAGTYTNRKEEAIKGVELLANAVPTVLGVTVPDGGPETQPSGSPARNSGLWAALVWIIVLTLLGGGLFVLLNAGDLNDIKRITADFYKRYLAGTAQPIIEKIPLDKWRETIREKLKTLQSRRQNPGPGIRNPELHRLFLRIKVQLATLFKGLKR